MDISIGALVAGFLVSTIGFSLLLYGKKQARIPQLIVGCLMLVAPFVVPGALWISVAGVAAIGGLWFAVRMGC